MPFNYMLLINFEEKKNNNMKNKVKEMACNACKSVFKKDER